MSGHSTLVRESNPITAVESVSTSMWMALSTRPAGSPLMRITQVQDFQQLPLRCIQSCQAGACTELACPAVPSSFVDLQSFGIFGAHFGFFLVAFHFLNTALSRFTSASTGSFLQDPCCSGCQSLCLHPLQWLSMIAASCLGSSINLAPCILLSTI